MLNSIHANYSEIGQVEEFKTFKKKKTQHQFRANELFSFQCFDDQCLILNQTIWTATRNVPQEMC